MSRSSGMRGRLPVIAVSLFLLLFANLALGMQEGTVFFDRQDELPNTYEDLERTVSLLRQHAGPDDLLLVSYQGLSAYQAYLRKEAIPYEPARVTTIEEEGLRFVYSPESGWFFTPESVVRSYFDARKALRLDRVERVWVVRGTGWPWEKPIRDWFHHDYRDVRLDDALVVESRGWLMPARAGDLDSHATEVASIEKFYTEDFIRSQIPPEQRKTPDYFIAP